MGYLPPLVTIISAHSPALTWLSTMLMIVKSCKKEPTKNQNLEESNQRYEKCNQNLVNKNKTLEKEVKELNQSINECEGKNTKIIASG